VLRLFSWAYGTHRGGEKQNSPGEAKTNLGAYLIYSKGRDAFIVGCQCGVDLIDSIVITKRGIYITSNIEDNSILLDGV